MGLDGRYFVFILEFLLKWYNTYCGNMMGNNLNPSFNGLLGRSFG